MTTLRVGYPGRNPFDASTELSTTLFAYSAQSHLNGRRYPLTWSKAIKERYDDTNSRIYTLLDAASFCATSVLDLSHPDYLADFTVLSLYKIFGFPDLGALIVRKDAESVFDYRKYFGGGTVDMVVTGKEQWHAWKHATLHERLEDGTLPFHNIIAVDSAIRVHKNLFGSMKEISCHTSYLTTQIICGLKNLRHVNGKPVCVLYTDLDRNEWSLGTGPVVSFNLQNQHGAWISLYEFEKLANVRKVFLRTGGVCSPGGIADALSLKPWEIRRNFSAGFRCGSENDVIAGKPTGIIRVSFGAMSTISDVERFVEFIKEFYVEKSTAEEMLSCTESWSRQVQPLLVRRITVYPIKSCAGFDIPSDMQWDVRPEGLAWDREWCILHKGSGQALSQKRYPRMALIRPSLDFESGVLRVKLHGEPDTSKYSQIAIPLSDNPACYESSTQRSAKVCGDSISTKVYASKEVNDFFSEAVGIPCILARFPPGGQGVKSRSSKLVGAGSSKPRSSTHLMPSPPDSDSEQQKKVGKLLLSNESPILMVHKASVDALNYAIKKCGGEPVQESAFRANIIVQGSAKDDRYDLPPYSEDSWQSVRIGNQPFKLLGGCQRCQMVCVDQQTGEKRQEPFVTLSKTRRMNGKVIFGMHMRHDPPSGREDGSVAIAVGDIVSVEL